MITSSGLVFQLTTSQGGRRHCIVLLLSLNHISTHDLARRSTPSASISPFRSHFNSRPRKEVDEITPCNHVVAFSFQLTTSQGGRRSIVRNSIASIVISTHDLARRSTCNPLNSRTSQFYFNSRPRKEVDTVRGCSVSIRSNISTHDLARRSTWEHQFYCFRNIFQLTTSQGGRPRFLVPLYHSRYFNSRPRKEVDSALEDTGIKIYKFQLTTSQGGRPRCSRNE